MKNFRIVLHISYERLALNNIRFIVADEELVCEDIFIGVSVLLHLLIDTKVLLENNRVYLED